MEKISPVETVWFTAELKQRLTTVTIVTCMTSRDYTLKTKHFREILPSFWICGIFTECLHIKNRSMANENKYVREVQPEATDREELRRMFSC